MTDLGAGMRKLRKAVHVYSLSHQVVCEVVARHRVVSWLEGISLIVLRQNRLHPAREDGNATDE